jgi:hypothetical protein
MVDPLTLLNEKVEGDNVPVPENSIPVTVDVSVLDIVEFRTVRTLVRSLEVCVDVPPNTMPFNTTLFVDPVHVRLIVKSSTRQFSPIVSIVVELVTFI